MRQPQAGNKVIVGWLSLNAGAEQAFDAIITRYLEECRAEPECRFFEMMRTREDPSTVLVCECFDSEVAHDLHLQRPHVRAFFTALSKIAGVGKFQNMVAAKVTPDAVDFSTMGR
jgi:quinol monooxygenase YgiN